MINLCIRLLSFPYHPLFFWYKDLTLVLNYRLLFILQALSSSVTSNVVSALLDQPCLLYYYLLNTYIPHWTKGMSLEPFLLIFAKTLIQWTIRFCCTNSAPFQLSSNVVMMLALYLSNRSQVVKIGHVTSSPVTCNVGVPPGSILGPLLFFSVYQLPSQWVWIL